jgi:hypothetical protein
MHCSLRALPYKTKEPRSMASTGLRACTTAPTGLCRAHGAAPRPACCAGLANLAPSAPQRHVAGAAAPSPAPALPGRARRRARACVRVQAQGGQGDKVCVLCGGSVRREGCV